MPFPVTFPKKLTRTPSFLLDNLALGAYLRLMSETIRTTISRFSWAKDAWVDIPAEVEVVRNADGSTTILGARIGHARRKGWGQLTRAERNAVATAKGVTL